jgi:hypothetical protein
MQATCCWLGRVGCPGVIAPRVAEQQVSAAVPSQHMYATHLGGMSASAWAAAALFFMTSSMAARRLKASTSAVSLSTWLLPTLRTSRPSMWLQGAAAAGSGTCARAHVHM